MLGRSSIYTLVESMGSKISAEGQEQVRMDFPIRQKLTRKFFMELPAGSYLASNCFKSGLDLTPIYSGYVAENGMGREFQWELIKASRAAQHTCVVYPNEGDYLAYLEHIRKQANKTREYRDAQRIGQMNDILDIVPLMSVNKGEI